WAGPTAATRTSTLAGERTLAALARGGTGCAGPRRHLGLCEHSHECFATTRTVPIVFVTVIDPVGAGYVESLAHAGGNRTGFSLFEYGLSGKWPELLKEIAPGVTRVAVLRDIAVGSGVGQYAIIQAVAPSLGLELRPIDMRDAGEIERAVVAFA